MQLIKTKKELQESLVKHSDIGFIPTMGALHQGHISLIERALTENKVIVVSIFINPTQFDNKSDLETYPNTLKEDLKLLERTDDNIIVFHPSIEEIYKNQTKSKTYPLSKIAQQMEGKFRKGHFQGVCTIVEILFDCVKPNKAYFGEKDFQQLQIIKELTHEILKLPIKIVSCAIFREKNGLAMSSRNQKLSLEEKQQAGIIFQVLQDVKKQFQNQIEIDTIKNYVEITLNKVQSTRIEYFTIAEEETLISLETSNDINPQKKYRAFIAVFFGEKQVRLIDNLGL